MTNKQLSILTSLAEAAERSVHLDLDQLIDILEAKHRWEVSKPSLHFSLRPMLREAFVKKIGTVIRRNRRRTVIGITDLGCKVLGRTPVPEVSSSETVS